MPLWSLASCALLLQASSAHAYLDPNTGSIAVQTLIGGIALGMGVMSAAWQRLKSLFRPGGSGTPAQAPLPDAKADDSGGH